MNKEKTLIFSLSAILFLAASFIVYSWSEPTATMPGDYTAPINTSDTGQTKEGWLKLNGPLTTPMIYDADGCVGDNCPYYINPSGNSIISGKIITEGSIGLNDSPGTIATKGYVDGLIGDISSETSLSNVTYIFGNSPSCPEESAELMRHWKPKTCIGTTGHSGCSPYDCITSSNSVWSEFPQPALTEILDINGDPVIIVILLAKLTVGMLCFVRKPKVFYLETNTQKTNVLFLEEQ